MRVTTNAMFNHISESTGNHFNAISNQMMHTQYRVLQSGDDPIAQGRIINLNRSISELTTYKTSADVLKTELSEVESQVESYNDLYTELSTIFSKVTNGTMNSDDKKILSKQMDGLIDEMAQILNMQNTSGDYAFGGTVNDSPPFVKEKQMLEIDGVEREVEIWVYKGNDEQKHTQVGSSVSLPSTVVGSDLVTANGTTIFETLAKVQFYIKDGGDIPETVKDEVELSFEDLLDQKIAFQSDIGHSYATAERNTNMYQSMIDEYTGLLSSTQDADYISVVTEIKKQEQIMSALAQTSKVIMEMATLRFN
ncbi:hypothetical protein OTK49_00375 [Vibrio coralliirubri]|uniref:hypothetical protein n=1 Tax=Vibrio coralliirubri TaxID=1516159 RepID=UPI0022847DE1|nr:hypothetical protein [Vibrio coralliirubri]MCY9860996.1 hypothetical protein [Vibrio coralliirubri]